MSIPGKVGIAAIVVAILTGFWPAFAQNNPANVVNVPTIAKMQALVQPGAFYSTVNVQSYRAGANSGGGIFQWVSGSLPCNAVSGGGDGGTTFCTSNGSGGYLTTGYWKRQIAAGFITPQMFGAVCDGSTDDTTAIQNAENAAGTLTRAVQFIGPNYCKVTSAIKPKANTDHYCAAGMNGIGPNTVNCGILQATVGAWVYDMPSTDYGVSDGNQYQAPSFHDMWIDSAGGGIRIGNPAATTFQAVANYLSIRRVFISTAGTYRSIDCTLCFYAVVEHNWLITGLQFYMSDYVTVEKNSIQQQNASPAEDQPAASFLSDNTFGNDNRFIGNFVEFPIGYSGAGIQSTANSVTIQDNGFECGGSVSLSSLIDLPAPSSSGGFHNHIVNNQIACLAANATHWLSVENTQFLYTLEARDNWCNCTVGAPSFNGGSGIPLYVPSTTFTTKIFHENNASDANFPAFGRNDIPQSSGQLSPGLLISYTPGNANYNANSADYGSSVVLIGNTWQIPSGGNKLDFDQSPTPYTGVVDICMLSSGSTTVTLEAFDDGVSLGTATPATTALTWTCVSNVTATTKATATVTSAGSGPTTDLFQVIIRQHGV